MDKDQKQQILEIVPAVITNMPKLTFRLGAAYLRFRGQANGAVRDFKKGLCDGGLSPEEANRLAGDFADGTRFLSLSMLKNVSKFGAREKK